jgi:putative nucleotidyltransferase with HDIG domain
MRFQLTHKELERLLPSDAALAAHCQRVAGLALEIAPKAMVPARSRVTLEQAALLHHSDALLLGTAAFERLAGEVLTSAAARSGRPLMGAPPKEIEETLRAFHGQPRRQPDRGIRRLAEVLILSNMVDEEMEIAMLEPPAPELLWERLQGFQAMFEFGVLEAARKALPVCTEPAGDCGWDLPVQAVVAQEVITALAGSRECELPFLVDLAERDPVMAGRLLQAANSPLFGRRGSAKSIRQAITFIGIHATRQLLLALAFQTLFASANLHAVWQHSVWMGRFAQSLAHLTGFADSEEALLLGLVHDIGTVAIQARRHMGTGEHDRLAESGCPPVYLERLRHGRDHADIGAGLLEAWHFPETMVEAVRFHHRPADADSLGAAALFLAEFWAEGDEDLPSVRHLAAAFARTGWSTDTLFQAVAANAIQAREAVVAHAVLQ